PSAPRKDTRRVEVRDVKLLLDEVAAGMNPSETREIMDDICAIHKRDCTILLIEHDTGLVEEYLSGDRDRLWNKDRRRKLSGSLLKPAGHRSLSRARRTMRHTSE